MQDAQDKGSKAPYLKNTLERSCLDQVRKKENYIDDSHKNLWRDLRQLKPRLFPDIYVGRCEKRLYLPAKCAYDSFKRLNCIENTIH